MSGRRHKTSPPGVPLRSPGGGIFAPFGLGSEADRLCKALIGAYAEGSDAAQAMLALRLRDPKLAATVALLACRTAGELARQLGEQQQQQAG